MYFPANRPAKRCVCIPMGDFYWILIFLKKVKRCCQSFFFSQTERERGKGVCWTEVGDGHLKLNGRNHETTDGLQLCDKRLGVVSLMSFLVQVYPLGIEEMKEGRNKSSAKKQFMISDTRRNASFVATNAQFIILSWMIRCHAKDSDLLGHGDTGTVRCPLCKTVAQFSHWPRPRSDINLLPESLSKAADAHEALLQN